MYFFPSTLTNFSDLDWICLLSHVSFHFFPYLPLHNTSECYSPHAIDICQWSLFIFKLYFREKMQKEKRRTNYYRTTLKKYPYSSGGRCENKSTTNSATAYIIWRWQERRKKSNWKSTRNASHPPVLLLVTAHCIFQ